MPRTQLVGQQVLDDSLTGDDVREETLIDSKIPFSAAGFSATNVHDAIIEALRSVLFYGVLDQDITVPANMSIIMVSPVIGQHEITIEGELVIL